MFNPSFMAQGREAQTCTVSSWWCGSETCWTDSCNNAYCKHSGIGAWRTLTPKKYGKIPYKMQKELS